VDVGLLVPGWGAPQRVQAACTLRAGGISRAPFDSLNLGDHVGDEPAAVAENRRRVRTALALPCEPLWLQQVHGARVVDADAPPGPGSGPADAAVTRTAGRVLAILVADCMPVLLASEDGHCIAAAHAGWRGLAAGVVEATVAAMGVAGHRCMHGSVRPSGRTASRSGTKCARPSWHKMRGRNGGSSATAMAAGNAIWRCWHASASMRWV